MRAAAACAPAAHVPGHPPVRNVRPVAAVTVTDAKGGQIGRRNPVRLRNPTSALEGDKERSMTAKFEPRDWATALNQLKAAGTTAKTAATPQAPASDEDWRKQEQFRLKVIEARVKLKLMRDRTNALKDALERYRQRESSRA